LCEIRVGQSLVERLHARLSGTGLHCGINLVDLVFTDQVADGRRRNENLHHHDATSAVGPWEKCLAKYAFEHHGELRANLRLLMRGKDVDNAVDGGGSRVGMQGGKGQVAGLSDAQRGLDSFQVAHLTDEHDVGVFTKRGTQRVGEGMGIRVYFALVDEALLVIVQKLDRVLDGDHVLFAFAVDLVQHGGERGGLTGTSRAGHQNQPTRFVAQTANYRWKAQSIESLDFPGDGTEDSADRTALIEYVAAET